MNHTSNWNLLVKSGYFNDDHSGGQCKPFVACSSYYLLAVRMFGAPGRDKMYVTYDKATQHFFAETVLLIQNYN